MTTPEFDVGARDDLVGRALRRYVAWIVLGSLLGGLLAAAYAFSRPVRYTSTASVLLKPSPGNAFSPQSAASFQQIEIAMTTEAALTNSGPVLAIAQKRLGNEVTATSSNVTGTVPPNTQIVQVQFTSASPRQAHDGAHAVANALLTYRTSQSAAAIAGKLDQLGTQVDAANGNLKAAKQGAATNPAASAQKVRLYESKLSSLNASVQALKATASDPGTVIKPASSATTPSSLSPWIYVVVGVLLALAFSVTIALWRERNDDRVRSGSTSVAGLPVLARIPVLDAQATVASAAPDSRLRDAFRTARAALLAAAPPPKTIAVASLDERDDSGLLALNLAQTLAGANYRVVLVVATAGSQVGDVLHVHAQQGLTEVIEQEADVDPILVDRDGLSVLPYGLAERRDADVFAGARFPALLGRLERGRDYVILVSDPVSTPGGLDVTLLADVLVLACASERSTQDQVRQASASANELGTPVLGTLLVTRRRGRIRRRARRAKTGPEASSTELAPDGPTNPRVPSTTHPS